MNDRDDTGDRPADRVRSRTLSADIEIADARFREHRFAPHRHDTYAIGCTTEGVQRFFYRGEDRTAVPGDVFVLHPDERHDGRPGTPDGYRYRIAYLSPRLIAEALPGPCLPFVAEAVSRRPALKAAVTAVLRIAEDGADGLASADAVARLAGALAAAGGAAPASASAGPIDIARITRIRDELADRAPERIGAGDLARRHGIDRFTLARQFRRVFGVSPRRYVTLRRLDLVRERVRAGDSLAEAALAAGFADQSHMTRQFGSAFGLPPGAWRALGD